MKRFVALLLCLVLALSLTACGKQEDKVVFTLSKHMLDIVGASADEMVDASDKEGRITKKKDGSVTCKLTKEEHEGMLAYMRQSLDQMIGEIKNDVDLSSYIDDITYNEDMSEIVITADREACEAGAGSFGVAPALGKSGMLYQMYCGVPEDEIRCVVALKNRDTGVEFDALVYPDALEETASE